MLSALLLIAKFFGWVCLILLVCYVIAAIDNLFSSSGSMDEDDAIKAIGCFGPICAVLLYLLSGYTLLGNVYEFLFDSLKGGTWKIAIVGLISSVLGLLFGHAYAYEKWGGGGGARFFVYGGLVQMVCVAVLVSNLSWLGALGMVCVVCCFAWMGYWLAQP